MFTGIIQAIGSIQEFHSSDNGANLKINSNTLDISDSKIGDSIAVNGVCLTVTEISGEWFCCRCFKRNDKLHNFFRFIAR